TTTAEPVAIAIADANGNLIRTATAESQAGANTWTWDGTSNSGTKMPDGAYNIAVESAPSSGGSATAVPFTVGGTVTGTQNTTSNGMQLQVGALGVGFGALQSLSD
ncbi:MAG: FlgD immunoglobulin-like domain containing protein, partial [Acetobacteraceae bacterium]